MVAPPAILRLLIVAVNLSDGAIPQASLHSHREAQSRGTQSAFLSRENWLLRNITGEHLSPSALLTPRLYARSPCRKATAPWRFASIHCMWTPARPPHQPRFPQFDPHRLGGDNMMYSKSIITSPKGLTARGVGDDLQRCLRIVATGEKGDKRRSLGYMSLMSGAGGCCDLKSPAPNYVCRCGSELPTSPASSQQHT